MGSSVEIICVSCGADALLRREPVYDGFKKVGEKLTCASCGHEFESEDDVPFTERKKISIFSVDDVLEKVEVFRDDERSRNCRYCAHYTVNPFTQRCGLHLKEVQATDICPDFEKKPENEAEPEVEKHGRTGTDTD